MAICGALCYGALAARYPQAGGGYVYLREAYGPRVAFLYGWKCLLIMDPGITAALADGFRELRGLPGADRECGARLVAVAAIVAFAVVHILGVKLGVRLLTTVSVLKIALVFALTLGALASPAGSWSHFTPFVERHAGAMPLMAAIAGAFVSAFFTFGGWWEVTKIAGEVRDPARTLPKALWLGLVVVTLVYTAATISFIYVIPIGEIIEGQAFVAQVGEASSGPVAARRRARRDRVRAGEPRRDADAGAAVVFRHGPGRPVPGRRGCGPPALRHAGPGDRDAGGARVRARRARHVRHDRRLLRVHHRGVHRGDGGFCVRAPPARSGVPRPRLPLDAGRVSRDGGGAADPARRQQSAAGAARPRAGCGGPARVSDDRELAASFGLEEPTP